MNGNYRNMDIDNAELEAIERLGFGLRDSIRFAYQVGYSRGQESGEERFFEFLQVAEVLLTMPEDEFFRMKREVAKGASPVEAVQIDLIFRAAEEMRRKEQA